MTWAYRAGAVYSAALLGSNSRAITTKLRQSDDLTWRLTNEHDAAATSNHSVCKMQIQPPFSIITFPYWCQICCASCLCAYQSDRIPTSSTPERDSSQTDTKTFLHQPDSLYARLSCFGRIALLPNACHTTSNAPPYPSDTLMNCSRQHLSPCLDIVPIDLKQTSSYG